MPKYKDIKRVMVIGSGPIVIGQAAEFDYAGTQACKSLREENIEVILVNSNPATIMTDLNMADKIYLEPLTVDFLEKIIRKEKPDGLLPTLGGQTGLNLAVELSEAGILSKYGVKLLGTPLTAIKKAEDRELFKNLMIEIGEPIPPSAIVNNMKDAVEFAREIGYPVIVRPAYTLGGLGGGIAENEEQLIGIATRGFKNSRISQVLIEKSVAGWKEIEYEVLRDSNDTCITICNMENIDPVGIHTGDSIVLAPSQTLCDREYQMLRAVSIRIIRALGIEGGCNVQLALDPYSENYVVIEVNPRVSRSSALASKATGYPIAKVSAKIAIGLWLSEIENSVTKKTLASFEPTLDYVVTKIPRWPFDKFAYADRSLGTQMKATGEVMAIDRTIEGSIMKAIRSLEIRVDGPWMKEISEMGDDRLIEYLKLVDDRRLFVIFELLRRDYPIGKIARDTKMDLFFLKKFENIIRLEKEVKKNLNKDIVLSGVKPGEDTVDFLRTLKKNGFGDTYLARMLGVKHAEFRNFRKLCGIVPVYKMVDTCAAEFEAVTPYYYSTYEDEDEVAVSGRRKVVSLGSGPIRIGQGIEFDYCSVHSAWGLQQEDIESIIINNNPETVSTDFDTSDKLYFEPLNPEDVMNVIDKEKPEGVIVQFAGQTALNLAKPMLDFGVKILGTSVDSIDIAEDRKRFNDLLHSIGVLQPEGKSVISFEQALGVTNKLGYPVLVRPSYVIGGHAMEIVQNDDELFQYMRFATEISPDHPVLVDKYMVGKEVEIDAICDGTDVFIPGIFEQIERAGVHSGDSMAVFPPFKLTDREVAEIVKQSILIGRALKVVGLMNIQYVISGGRLYCIEVNPRASRTVPIMSKVTGIEMVNLATKIMNGKTLKQLGYKTGLMKRPDYYTIKAPVFSFDKLKMVETSLGPEMKSTGEVLGVGFKSVDALYKAIVGAGLVIPKTGNVLLSIASRDKNEISSIAERLIKLGYRLFGTKESAKFLKEKGMEIESVLTPGEGSPNVLDLMRENKINIVFNTPTKGKSPAKLGFKIRRAAVEYRIPCITSIDTALSAIKILEEEKKGNDLPPLSLNDLLVTYMDKTITE
jgi:carbamoyl-phosphate synthase large subunit